MTLTPRLRKLALTAHITFSVGWLGAVVAYLALAITILGSQDAQIVRSAWISMEFIGWYVIVPLALAALFTGLVQGLGTPWGLFRHYWVLFKLLLTVFATVILLLHMPTVSVLTDKAISGAELPAVQGELVHAGGGLIVLFIITVLSIYKPRGTTPYGRRKQSESRTTSSSETDHMAIDDTPWWVRVFGIIAIVLIVLFVAKMLTGGGHGPGRHTSTYPIR